MQRWWQRQQVQQMAADAEMAAEATNAETTAVGEMTAAAAAADA